MTLFNELKFNDQNFSIVCEFSNTRNGFKHTCNLINQYGIDIATAKFNYINRTWESYEYKSTIIALLNKHFVVNQKTAILPQNENAKALLK
jgi:hypothetical protein